MGGVADPVEPILPGARIGLLGGGQLGRMFGIAARRMGYRVHALDPSADCPAGQVADLELNVPYDDVDAAVAFAQGVDVVTFEFENVPAETLAAVAEVRPVHPSPGVLQVCRHRLREKKFLKQHRFPHAEWREVRSPGDVAAGVAEFGGGILKTAEFGYDGKGQTRLHADADAAACDAAWDRLGRPASAVLEAVVPFDCELSVIVARTAEGACRPFPVGRNDHASGILDVTTVPSGLPPAVEREAAALAAAVADALDVIGVLAVEMFLVVDGGGGGGQLLVNELAPRPHNSGHWTFDFCATSQFEQQLRAVCGLPLGDTTALAGGIAMANLLGDLWNDGEPRWPATLSRPNVKLHLYGKSEARPGRKMGHLTAFADAPDVARRAVVQTRDLLRGKSL